MKSELHFTKDGHKLPLIEFWKQIINEVRPALIIITGAAGGIGRGVQLGNVIVSQQVRFECSQIFKEAIFNKKAFSCDENVNLEKVNWANDNLMGITTPYLPGS